MENGSGGFMGGRLSASLLFELSSQRYQISYSMEGSSASGSGTSSARILLLWRPAILTLALINRFTVRNITVNNAVCAIYGFWNWGESPILALTCLLIRHFFRMDFPRNNN
jgi:hypothetical protein